MTPDIDLIDHSTGIRNPEDYKAMRKTPSANLETLLEGEFGKIIDGYEIPEENFTQKPSTDQKPKG